MGLCHYHLKQDEEVIAAFERALFINPVTSFVTPYIFCLSGLDMDSLHDQKFEKGIFS